MDQSTIEALNRFAVSFEVREDGRKMGNVGPEKEDELKIGMHPGWIKSCHGNCSEDREATPTRKIVTLRLGDEEANPEYRKFG